MHLVGPGGSTVARRALNEEWQVGDRRYLSEDSMRG
jgi:hypothetical protein